MASSSIALQNIHHQSEHRSASFESVVSIGTESLGSVARSPEQTHSGTQHVPPSAQSLVRRTSSNQPTEHSHQLLSPDDSDKASDNDDENSDSVKSSLAPYYAVFAWWIPELFASLLSVVSFGCIIAVLRTYDGSLLTDIDLPKNLTLNGVIAALATVNRACLNTPVCSAILQQMWLYLAKESKANGPPKSRLRDLELYTDASSGAWGSLMFLCKVRLPRIAACFGCAITILSLAFSTFTQQLVSIELVDIRNLTSPGNLPYCETYSKLAVEGSRLTTKPPLDIIAGIYNGMLGTDVRPVRATCPTANCTWPITPSVGVCGACAESTFVTSGCDECPPSSGTCNCNYTLASGTPVQLFDFLGHPEGAGGPGFFVSNMPQPGLDGVIFDKDRDNRAYLSIFELFGVPFGLSMEDPYAPGPSKPMAEMFHLSNTECALWMCVQAYNTFIESNIQHDDIVRVFDSVDANDWARNPQQTMFFQMPDVPAEFDRDGLTNFTAARQATGSLQTYFQNTFKGNVSIARGGMYDSTNDLVYGAWNGSTNASAWIQNTATSMSNSMRLANSTFREQYNGTRHELAVVVRWTWLALPAALVAASLLYLFVVMFQTAASPVQSWKGSPLTMLLFELDPGISEGSHGHVDERGGLSRSIGHTKVRMMEHAGGIRKFHAC